MTSAVYRVGNALFSGERAVTVAAQQVLVNAGWIVPAESKPQ